MQNNNMNTTIRTDLARTLRYVRKQNRCKTKRREYNIVCLQKAMRLCGVQPTYENALRIDRAKQNA